MSCFARPPARRSPRPTPRQSLHRCTVRSASRANSRIPVSEVILEVVAHPAADRPCGRDSWLPGTVVVSSLVRPRSGAYVRTARGASSIRRWLSSYALRPPHRRADHSSFQNSSSLPCSPRARCASAAPPVTVRSMRLLPACGLCRSLCVACTRGGSGPVRSSRQTAVRRTRRAVERGIYFAALLISQDPLRGSSGPTCSSRDPPLPPSDPAAGAKHATAHRVPPGPARVPADRRNNHAPAQQRSKILICAKNAPGSRAATRSHAYTPLQRSASRAPA